MWKSSIVLNCNGGMIHKSFGQLQHRCVLGLVDDFDYKVIRQKRRFWLFEPRSVMHDIGGWYIETFGRDNKGKTVPTQRYWDGLDTNAHCEDYQFAIVFDVVVDFESTCAIQCRLQETSSSDVLACSGI
ncbi:hypothetical protein PHJA_002601100 [Phtheirospermum japonicum]|uniref:Uncharacterized protein n=1 Tax=Phtheirospermum japonicum TaxID=374723 RepID=A0A830DE58_9LAMI|nr:hypothetical protein PHJA_002601100 [Phtheirospermum japonicum]